MKLVPCDICGSHHYYLLYVTKDRNFPKEGTYNVDPSAIVS